MTSATRIARENRQTRRLGVRRRTAAACLLTVSACVQLCCSCAFLNREDTGTSQIQLTVLDLDTVLLHGKTSSLSQATAQLRSLRQGSRLPTIVLTANAATPWLTVREVMDLATGIGYSDFVLVTNTVAGNQPGVRAARKRQFIDVPPEEVRAVPGTHDATTRADLLIHGNAYFLNGKRLSKLELDQALQLLSRDEHASVLRITCEKTAKHGDLVWVLERCSALGLGPPQLLCATANITIICPAQKATEDKGGIE